MKNKIYRVLVLQCDETYRCVYETSNCKKAYEYYNDYKRNYIMKIDIIETKRKKHGYDDIKDFD